LFRREVNETPAFMQTIARTLKYHISSDGKFLLSTEGLENMYVNS